MGRSETPVQLPPTVGVLGYGVDGRSVTQWLLRQPQVRRVVVFDDRPIDPTALAQSASGVPLEVGASITGIDLLFRSPGVRPDHSLLQRARECGVRVTSSYRTFLRHFPGVTVGVTGSNGKTTCSTLIAKFLAEQYPGRVQEGGNDRVPRLDLLPSEEGGGAPGDRGEQIVVLEVSSFQLIDAQQSPHLAVVLNLTPNHLDWHASMGEYAEAKRQIVAHQGGGDIAVLNAADPTVRRFAEGLRSRVVWFGQPRARCRVERDTILLDGAVLLARSSVRCRTHDYTLLAAITAAAELGVSPAHLVEVLHAFPGVAHRLELVRELEGIRWYNDSSCTTPESAIAACEAFPVGSLVLLLGGRDKGMDFSALYRVIRERSVRVVPYGEMAEVFEREIPLRYKLKAQSSFGEAIHTARVLSKPGDCVVLSPACASFDMFPNAKERGRIFEELVRNLR